VFTGPADLTRRGLPDDELGRFVLADTGCPAPWGGWRLWACGPYP
jgi:hypothetical protein